MNPAYSNSVISNSPFFEPIFPGFALSSFTIGYTVYRTPAISNYFLFPLTVWNSRVQQQFQSYCDLTKMVVILIVYLFYSILPFSHLSPVIYLDTIIEMLSKFVFFLTLMSTDDYMTCLHMHCCLNNTGHFSHSMLRSKNSVIWNPLQWKQRQQMRWWTQGLRSPGVMDPSIAAEYKVTIYPLCWSFKVVIDCYSCVSFDTHRVNMWGGNLVKYRKQLIMCTQKFV